MVGLGCAGSMQEDFRLSVGILAVVEHIGLAVTGSVVSLLLENMSGIEAADTFDGGA